MSGTLRGVAVLGVVAVLLSGVTATTAPAGAVSTTGTTTVTSDWGSGFCADVKVTTASSAPVSWTVPVYVTAGAPTTVWNGRSAAAGDHVVVRGETWNATVTAAAPTTFGYCATGRPVLTPTPTPTPTSTPTPTPTSTPTPSPSTTTTPTPGGNGLSLGYTVSAWSGGATVNVTVTNRGPAVTSWKVDLPWSLAVSSVWSGISTSAGGHVVVANEAWNGTLPTGASATFGMSVTGAVPTTTTCSAVTSAGAAPCVVTGAATPGPTTSPSASPTTSPTVSPSPAPTVTPAPLPADFRLAPYVDMAGWPVPDLKGLRTATGISTYSLAFVTSAGSCTPAWGGIASLGMSATGDQITTINASIAALQAAGGKVLVSFGGANGSELAQTCTDVTALTAAYRTVVDKYGLTRLDFDIEGGAQGDRAANVRRGKALAALQAERRTAGKSLTVGFTLPVLPSGLTADGLNVLKDTQSGGAVVDLVNVMAMDYGADNFAMGQAAIDAATATAGQVGFLYPNTTAAQRLTRVGVTPMIGENDVPHEVFTLADAQRVTAWTKANGVGELAWWSMTRDTPCPNNGAYASPTCSGTSNPAWAYAKAFAG